MIKWKYNRIWYTSIPIDWKYIDSNNLTLEDIYKDLAKHNVVTSVRVTKGTSSLDGITRYFTEYIWYNSKWNKCYLLRLVKHCGNGHQLKALIHDIYDYIDFTYCAITNMEIVVEYPVNIDYLKELIPWIKKI